MGALIAYEVARELEARGRDVAHLLASGRHAPHDHRPGGARTTDDELIADLVRLGGVDEAHLADPVIRKLTLPVVRNDYRVDEAYRHRPGDRLRCPVTAMLGGADPEVTPEQAARWGELTGGRFTARVLDGDHFYLVPRRTEAVAHVLRAVSMAWPSTP